jgi:hypothetical protein
MPGTDEEALNLLASLTKLEQDLIDKGKEGNNLKEKVQNRIKAIMKPSWYMSENQKPLQKCIHFCAVKVKFHRASDDFDISGSRYRLLSLLMAMFFELYDEEPRQDPGDQRKLKTQITIASWSDLYAGGTSAVHKTIKKHIPPYYGYIYLNIENPTRGDSSGRRTDHKPYPVPFKELISTNPVLTTLLDWVFKGHERNKYLPPSPSGTDPQYRGLSHKTFTPVIKYLIQKENEDEMDENLLNAVCSVMGIVDQGWIWMSLIERTEKLENVQSLWKEIQTQGKSLQSTTPGTGARTKTHRKRRYDDD